MRAAQVGGGTGRLARDVLDHVRQAAPDVYARMHYTCMEISPRLAALQRGTLKAHPAHQDRCSVRSLPCSRE